MGGRWENVVAGELGKPAQLTVIGTRCTSRKRAHHVSVSRRSDTSHRPALHRQQGPGASMLSQDRCRPLQKNIRIRRGAHASRLISERV